MADLATLAIEIESHGIERVVADLDLLGQKGEAAANRVATAGASSAQSFGGAFQRSTADASRAIEAQFTALQQLTANLGNADQQAIAIAQGVARGLREKATSAGLTAEQLERLTAAELALSGAAAGVVSSSSRIAAVNRTIAESSKQVADGEERVSFTMRTAATVSDQQSAALRRLIAAEQAAYAEDNQRSVSIRRMALAESEAVAMNTQLARSNEQVATSTSALSGVFQRFGGIITTALAGFTAVGVLRKFITETSEAQTATAQLEVAIQSTGGAAGRTAAQMNDLAQSLQQTTTFSDEAILSAETMLTTFDNISGDNFDRATRAAADLAARLGGDVASAAQLVGKALQEPDEGLSALNRQFRIFSEAERQAIVDMVNAGRAAEAQGVILDALGTKFGGAATAARNTLGGALRGLANDFGEVFEFSKDGTSGLVGFINALDNGVRHIRDFDAEIKGLAAAIGVAGLGAALSAVIPLISVSGVAAFISLAGSVRSLAGAFALLQLAIPGLNVMRAVTLLAAAATGGYVYWREKQSQADAAATDATKRLADEQARLANTPGGPKPLAVGADVQRQLADMQGAIDTQHRLNEAVGASELSLKLLNIQQDAQAEKAKAAVGHNVAEIAAINQKIDARARELAQAARLAEVDAAAQQRRAQTTQDTAATQAIRNETALAEAVARSSRAQSEASAASEHRWATIATGTQSTAAYTAASHAAEAADVAAQSAARDRERALAQLKIQQDAVVASTAAYAQFQESSRNATAQEVQHARERYDAAIAQIGVTVHLKTVQADLTDATNRQGDADARVANNTAFRDAIAARVAETNRATEAMRREAEAQRSGQAAVDALRIAVAGETAVREARNEAARRSVTLSEADERAIRSAAEGYEQAAIAVRNLAATGDLIRGFARNLERDLGRIIGDGLETGIGAGLARALQTAIGLAERFAPQIGKKLFSHQEYDPATSSLQTVRGLSAHDQEQLGYFSLAANAVQGFATALNALTGAVNKTAAQLDAEVRSRISARISLEDYRRQTLGSPIEQQLASSSSAAQQQRDQIESAFGGRRFEAERNKLLAEVSAIEAAQRAKIAKDFFDGIGRDLNALKGPAGEFQNQLDAIAKSYADNIAAVDALAKAMGYSAEQTAAAEAQVKALADAQRAAAKAAFEEAQRAARNNANNTLAGAIAGGPKGTLALAQAAELGPLYDKLASDTAAYQRALDQLNADIAAGADPAIIAAENYDVLTLSIVKSGDEATIAGKKWADAIASVNQAISDIQQGVSLGLVTNETGLQQEQQALGFGGLSVDQILALFTKYDPAQELTNEQRETNRRIAQYLGDFDRVYGTKNGKPIAQAIADAVGSTANNTAIAQQVRGETQAVSYAARNLSEVTGDRMADYLRAIYGDVHAIRGAVVGGGSSLSLDRPASFDRIDTSALDRWMTVAQRAAAAPEATATRASRPVVVPIVLNLDASTGFTISRAQARAIVGQLKDAIEEALYDNETEVRLVTGDTTVPG